MRILLTIAAAWLAVSILPALGLALIGPRLNRHYPHPEAHPDIHDITAARETAHDNDDDVALDAVE